MSTPLQLSATQRFIRKLVQQRLAMVALGFLALILIAALLAPQVAPYDPTASDFAATLQGPSSKHWLGTDHLGRDVLSRIIFGARLALLASLQAIAIAAFIGIPVGLLSGYRGGNFDRAAMWVNDLFLSLPLLIVAFAIIAIVGPGLANAMLAVGLVLSTRYARLSRGVVLAEREELYVDAARVSGIPTWSILFRHLLPNIASPLIIQTSILLGAVILIEATLSFIGLGAPVGSPSWGRMLDDARTYLGQQPFLAIPPGVAITLSVLAFNILGDGLRDALGREGGSQIAPQRAGKVQIVETKPSDAVLEVVDLQVRFPRPGSSEPMTMLEGISFSLKAGQTLGLVGESGSGKSMTAWSIMGLVPPPGQVSRGSIRLEGRELLNLSEDQLQPIRGNQIGMIFQEPIAALDPAFTVGEQLAEVLQTHQQMNKTQAWERAAALVEKVGVPEPGKRLHDYPHQFSGGMAQRVVIARALACGPKVLIADEPTTALDVSIQAQVLDLLHSLQDQMGLAILFITHNLGLVADICDRAAVMYAGQIVEVGEVEELMLRPKHPYTAALLNAMPENQPGESELASIPGQVPPPWDWPPGCRFHPRCGFAQEGCRSGQIELRELAEGHQVRCLRVGELNLVGAQ
jgi:peptide/nickel transport system permease protein